jgi:hypothetical protein
LRARGARPRETGLPWFAPGREEGIGLAEVIVAFAVLLIVLVPVSYVLNNVISQAGTAKSKIQALSIAEKWVEKLAAKGPPTVSKTTPRPTVGNPISVGTTPAAKTPPATPAPKKYTVAATIKYYPSAKFYWVLRTAKTPNTPDLCTSATIPQIIGLTVTVHYLGGSIKDTTVLDYPPAGLPKYGFLGVQVKGSPQSTTNATPPPTKGGVPWGGTLGRVDTVPITATSVATGTVYKTTAGPHGCGFFELLPGAYRIHVGPETLVTPFVTTGSTTATTITAPTPFTVVLSKTTVAGPYLYDEGSYVDVDYPNSTVTDGTVSCPDKSKFQCLVTGQGTVGSSTAAVNVLSGNSWSSNDLKATQGIQKILASSCSTAACVGVGYGSGTKAAAVLESPSKVNGWIASSPPSTLHVTMLRQVRCPKTTACVATGTTKTGPVILGATVNTIPSLSLTWSVDNTPPTLVLKSISSLTCTSGTACYVVATSTTGPVILAGAETGAAQTWAQETLQGSPTHIAGIACASGTACFVVGASGTTPIILAGGISSATETWYTDTLTSKTPAGTTLSSVACSGTTVCMAIGTSSSGPVVLAGGVASWASETWQVEKLPATMKSATVITCAKAACLVIGNDGAGDGIFAGAAQTSPSTWVADTVPSHLNLTKLLCTSTTACVATGRTTTGTATQAAVMLTGTASASKKKFTRVTFPAAATATLFSDVTHDGGKPGPAPNARHVELDSSVRLLAKSHKAPAVTPFAFARPTVTALAPAKGPAAGGTTVTITGANFTTVTRVRFGTKTATSYTVKSATQITAVDPAGTAGTAVNVVVRNNRGTSRTTTPFTYVAKPTVTAVTPTKGPTAGGTTVKITGTTFTTVTAVTGVKFGTTNATSWTVKSATQITAVAPAGAGTVKVTVTTKFGTGTKANAYTYIAPPTVTATTPTKGPTVGGTTVKITGTNFTTVTAVTFGTTTATSFTRTSATQITAVTPASVAGTVKVSVTTKFGTGKKTAAFTYVPAPTVTTVTPAKGPVAGGTAVKITGANFTTIVATTGVKFGTTNATSFTRTSATQITAVAPAGAAGSVKVSVTSKFGGTGTRANAYTYVAAPTVTALTPTKGPTAGGNTVKITATIFTAVTAVTGVKFGTTNATSFTRTSATQITAVAPAGVGTVKVTVSTKFGTGSKTAAYTYIAPPTVTALTPTKGPAAGGTAVKITGTNYTTVTAVKFGTTAATSFTRTSATQITAVTPAGAVGAVKVTVTTKFGTGTKANAFTYEPAPTVTTVTPAKGPVAGGTAVKITGANFTTIVAATGVKFGTTNATSFTRTSATQITAVAPAGAAGSVKVSVTSKFGGTGKKTNAYTYVAAPTVTAVTPTKGPTAGGTAVKITGTSFTTVTAVTGVKFGTTNATSFTRTSATQITAVAPAGAGTVKVTVSTKFGTGSKTAAYTYVAPPTVTTVTPAKGPLAGGTAVKITGTNYTTVTAVKFGTTTATSFTRTSATQITAVTPAGAAGAVKVTVTTKFGTGKKTAAFTYVGAPTVTSVTPAKGPVAGGTSVTIKGTNLTTVTGVKFGANAATTLTTKTAGQVTVKDPAGTAGSVTVSVTTKFGTGTKATAFTYVAKPTITTLTPIKGPAAGGTTVKITGTNLTTVAGVKFGTNAATTLTAKTASKGTITVKDPAGTAGSVPVSVTTTYGGTGTKTNAFTYIAGPAITNITPVKGPLAGGTRVTIKGTHFTTITGVKFGTSAATTLTTKTAGQVTVKDPKGTAGPVAVSVTTAFGGTGTKTGGFTYVGPPTITKITPSKGPLAGGTKVTITGTSLTTVSSIKFGTKAGTAISTESFTKVVVTTPSATKTGAVTVIVTAAGGTGTLGSGFTYLPLPTITGISPSEGPLAGGTRVTITGTTLTTVKSVTFGTKAATALSTNTSGQIVVTDPTAASAGAVTVTVTSAGGKSTKTNGFTYVAAPTITTVTPAKGPTAGGTVVSIKGTHLTTLTQVTFGTKPATTLTTKTAGLVKVKDPAGTAGAVTVTITTKYGGTGTKTNAFTYIGPPKITKVSPATGPAKGGTTVTITGTNFTTVTTVKFGTKAATTLRTNTPTQIKVKDPSGTPGPVTVSVAAAGGSVTLPNGFSYVAAPSIAKFNPTAGPTTGGTTVIITGVSFQTVTSVKFGATNAASYKVTSTTKITAVTPPHAAATVKISVTTPIGTGTSIAAFKFDVGPTLSSVSPPTGPTSGGTKVTLTGTNLTGVTSIKFGTTTATTFGVRAPTTVNVISPPHVPGKVTITLTTPGGTAQLKTAFTYAAPGPAIYSVSPPTGTTKGGTSVAITGHYLDTASSVQFGGVAATTVKVVSSTRITALTPAHAAGRVAVSVTTPSGTASKGTAFTYVTPPPTAPVFITGVACYSTTSLTCVAAGATKDGAILMVGTRQTSGAFTWQVNRAETSTAPIKGAVMPALPLSVGNTSLPSGSFVACTGTASAECTQAGPIFPFTKGYSVGAGSCLPELQTAPHVDTVPGTPAPTFGHSATVPLGIFAVKVIEPTGKAVQGANVTVTVNDTSSLNTACNSLTQNAGTTQADGTLAVAAIYERYSVTISKGTTPPVTVTIKVGPADQVLNAGSGTTTTLLPIAAVVTL